MLRIQLIKKAVHLEDAMNRERVRAYDTGNWTRYERLRIKWDRIQNQLDAIEAIKEEN